MPIYKFECGKCGKVYEDLVPKRGDSAPCPDCGCKKVERLISAPASRVSKDGGSITSSCPPSCSCSTGKCSHN